MEFFHLRYEMKSRIMKVLKSIKLSKTIYNILKDYACCAKFSFNSQDVYH